MKFKHVALLLLLLIVVIGSVFAIRSTNLFGAKSTVADFNLFFDLHTTDQSVTRKRLAQIKRKWHPGSAAMLVEMFHMVKFHKTKKQMADCLEEQTGQKFGIDGKQWQNWIWSQEYQPHPQYPEFQAKLYSHIDKRFIKYFEETDEALIRMDEIKWGGVRQDEIPPLDNPRMIDVSNTAYLDGSNEVFGISINGDHRCYPKRILAWHEMFKDTIGGVSVCGVYWTLCGSLIVYQVDQGDTHFELGTSGFLYRSNKLMYDKETNSLWSTIQGKPVVGPLVGEGIELERLHVVTTDWKTWEAQYPNSQVLSLKTGYRRDYREGRAYAEYFSHDRLMFDVPQRTDPVLKNKAEVFAMRSGESQLAISADFLRNNTAYQGKVAEQEFVVLTDPSGANRAYESNEIQFESWDGSSIAYTTDGNEWKVLESHLDNGEGVKLKRLPAHRAFWFGWLAQFPDTQLVN